VPGGFAILERRADVPPAEFGTLKKHDEVVARLARDVHAILPVRFGTLMEMDEIDEALAERDEEIADALNSVRDRVQFTWRRAMGSRRVQSDAARRGNADAPAGRSGTEYLRAVARAAKPAPPAAFRVVRDKLRRLSIAERYQPATASLPDSLYHLVDRSGISRYRSVAEGLAHASPILTLTGPFPPFAFTPGVL
jgi:hypothetical protein